MAELRDFLKDFANGSAVLGILSNTRTDSEYNKCKVTLVEIKGEILYHLELFTDKQAFHKNIKLDEIEAQLTTMLSQNFKQLEYTTKNFCYSLKFSKKEKLLTSKRVNTQNIDTAPKSHNREKDYILKEGKPIPPLVDLGVFTSEGKIIKAMYDKYKQINRFVEMIDDVIKKDNPKVLNIIDFGCGKSYLTFIVYYFLTEIKGIDTKITGLDLKQDVIDHCNKIAQNYGYDKLKFAVGDIADFKSNSPIDMVITLHACDTATDYALYHAINLDARIILSVPCCQHQLNGQIEGETLFTRYGIIKERFSALATDAIRANILSIMGYNTAMLEFVDLTHSPKNILIRAVKGKSDAKKPQLIKEIEDICGKYNLTPELYKLLYDKIVQQ